MKIINKIITSLMGLLGLMSVIMSGYVLILKLYSAITQKPILYFGQFTSGVIISESMLPNFHVGDYVIIESVNETDLKEGDICLYYNKYYKTYIFHRIDKIENSDDESLKYVFKGDNNDLRDVGLIDYQDIVGRCVKNNGPQVFDYLTFALLLPFISGSIQIIYFIKYY